MRLKQSDVNKENWREGNPGDARQEESGEHTMRLVACESIGADGERETIEGFFLSKLEEDDFIWKFGLTFVWWQSVAAVRTRSLSA